MPSNVFGLEWLNENAHRGYPFADYATLENTSSTIRIPEDLFVDLSLSVNADEFDSPSGFYLYELAIFGSGISGVIRHGSTEVTRFSIPSNAAKNATYMLYGSSTNFSSSIGSITIGNIQNAMKYAGVFHFTGPDQSGFVASCIKPDIRGVTSIYIDNGGEVSDPIIGDVVFEAGDNISIDIGSSGGSQVVTINAIKSDGFTGLTGTDAAIPNPIRTINGVVPDGDNNIQIDGRTCISFEVVESGLQFVNTCKEPCCSSEDLDALMDDVTQASIAINTQNINIGKLESRIVSLERINDILENLGFQLPE